MKRQAEKSDDDLMRDLQRGDADAFEEIVRRYKGPLSAFVAGRTRDPATRDDVVQETFIRVYEQHRDYIPMGQFRAWIYTIARNLCYDLFRQPIWQKLDPELPLLVWRRPNGDAGTASWLEEKVRDERLAQVRRAARLLPEAMRETVMLKYFHGLKISEISEVLECPVGTVKSRLHYALQRMAEELSD